MNFEEKLLTASRKNKSLLCVGLDPDPALMPDVDVVEFGRQIIEATKDLVCAYKPNFAFYEALGVDGLAKLDQTMRYVPVNIPTIADAKRGDIGNTARKYAHAIFDVFGFDAATVNPYMGLDAIQPFADYENKGTFILCHTSNASAADFQKIECQTDHDSHSHSLFELVAMKTTEWNAHQNLGLVIGATNPRPLKRIRELCPDMPLLIPGTGAQRGNLASAIRNGIDSHGEKAIIASSRQIIYASRGRDFPSATRLEASKLRTRINQFLAKK
ncbi:MAG: orotidine-5'-phosphate decarboxylase [Chloroflexota bacterium]|nr:orotidine-5'-phosphate decarboxylase [Chloroflexota bacterium]